MAATTKGGKSFSVAVEGMSTLAAIPHWLDRGQRTFLEKGVDELGRQIKIRAPGGPAGKAARDVDARVLTSTTAIIRSKGWPAAKVLERGGTIKPKRGKALKLHTGQFVRGSVFIKGRGYYRKGLRNRSKVINSAYQSAFHDLSRYGHA